MWRVALADAGVAVETVDVGHVMLRAGDQAAVALVRRLPILKPSLIPDGPGEPGLLVAERASVRAINDAVRKG
ncbi:MAG: hypothetical protein LBI99_10720, partial [Propionibacteriaceae bacterium]|nr:hypothetical protein [Propionibacteriaceae bacterium]